jgi:alkylhydroperoxidase family enzyme
MAGITPVDDAKLSSGMKALIKRFRDDPNYANGLGILAHKPEIAEIIWSRYAELLDNGRLPRDLKELVRVKLARNNDCSPYASKSVAGHHQPPGKLPREKIAAVDHYEISEAFTRREKLALKFADKLGNDQRALDEKFFDLLHQEFSEPEIVELAHVIAMGVGFERLIAVWAPRVCAL